MENPIIKERIKKLNDIKEMGIDPYPNKYQINSDSEKILKKFEKLKAGEKSKSNIKIAGRIMLIRKMGKAAFFHIQDNNGKIQIYIRKDEVGEENFKLFKKLDIGDIIGIEGTPFKTKTNETTINTKKLTLLTKTIRPLPEKYHGIQDKEIRYRKRYLDLIFNKDVKKRFEQRAEIIKTVRKILEKENYLEVETPTLQTIYGGANAKPFLTHINAWKMDLYLSVAPELYLKQLLVGGFDAVYTICKNFRNEGADTSHNPEFTMMECYKSYENLDYVLDIIEKIFETSCIKLHGTTKVKYKNTILDFKRPWTKITMEDAIKKHANIDVNKLTEKDLIKELTKNKIEYENQPSKGKSIQLLFEELVEDKLIQPTHILEHPVESSPLCKQKQDCPEIIERVESFIMGTEITNGYSELNDPIRQRQLLEEQGKELKAGAEEAHPVNNEFIEAIETGMPPAAGLGIGIDRMTMFLTNAETIRDVILFPTMKPQKD